MQFSALSWNSFIECLIKCLRYIFWPQGIAQHSWYFELPQENKVKLSQTYEESRSWLTFGARKTLPAPLLTPPPVPRVEDEFWVLSLPLSLSTHFCCSTHPYWLFHKRGIANHQKRRCLWAHCTKFLNSKMSLKGIEKALGFFLLLSGFV